MISRNTYSKEQFNFSSFNLSFYSPPLLRSSFLSFVAVVVLFMMVGCTFYFLFTRLFWGGPQLSLGAKKELYGKLPHLSIQVKKWKQITILTKVLLKYKKRKYPYWITKEIRNLEKLLVSLAFIESLNYYYIPPSEAVIYYLYFIIILLYIY